MEQVQKGTFKILKAVCAASHNKDDEDIVYCDCPFFRLDEGERICLGAGQDDPLEMMDMTFQEVLGACPLKDSGVLVILKE